MFTLALSIGIYSYLIFALGLLSLLYKPIIFTIAILFSFIVTFVYWKQVKMNWFKCFETLKQIQKMNLVFIKRNLLLIVALSTLVLQGIINFIGTLGPELGFDALWYHLTLPKIYLLHHQIVHIPGSLLYYSDMPKLTEMLYATGLALGSEIFAKLIHFSFGILTLFALYKISRKFLPKVFSLLVLVLFYSNLVVGWMSMTAYSDIARTFFEVMALWGFLEWIEKKEKKWLIESAVMLGLAVSTKLLALGSLFIFTILVIFFFLHHGKKIKDLFIGLFVYWFICLLIPLPWFIFSFTHTGNPVYPFFTNVYPLKFNFNLINSLNLSDPISPLYVVFLPLAVLLYRRFKLPLKIISLYSFLAILIWYLTPPTGGGRFILPYLPAFSVVSIVVVNTLPKNKLKYILIAPIIFLSLFSIVYRAVANSKYLPVILGKESKAQFLSNHLNFSFGDFYDTDGYFAKKIKIKDTVLLYGFHNLYYVNFPFIDSSYIKKGDIFNYIAVQGDNLPKRFNMWNLIYYNDKTKVMLYSTGGLKWVY